MISIFFNYNVTTEYLKIFWLGIRNYPQYDTNEFLLRAEFQNVRWNSFEIGKVYLHTDTETFRGKLWNALFKYCQEKSSTTRQCLIWMVQSFDSEIFAVVLQKTLLTIYCYLVVVRNHPPINIDDWKCCKGNIIFR